MMGNPNPDCLRFSVIIDAPVITLAKGELSPERWDFDFGIIPARRPYLAGPPLSASVLTKIALYVDPRARSFDCEALLTNYAFELRLNDLPPIADGPSANILTGSMFGAPDAASDLGIPIKVGDHITGAILLIPMHGLQFAATESFSFQFIVMGIGLDECYLTDATEPPAASTAPADTSTSTETGSTPKKEFKDV